jgi:YggT family protein
MLEAVFYIVEIIIQLIIMVLIVNAVISWLIAFEIVDPRNRGVDTLYGFTRRLTEPMLAPIRRVIPPVGGMDLSPLILILGLLFLSRLLAALLFA